MISRSIILLSLLVTAKPLLESCAHRPEPLVMDLSNGPLVPDDWTEDESDELHDRTLVRDPGRFLAELKSQVVVLDKVTGSQGQKATPDQNLIAPVRAAVQAQIAEMEGSPQSAGLHWRTALRATASQGRLSRMVFDHWVRFLARTAKPGSDALVVAREAIAAMEGGRDSPFLLTQGLLVEADLARRIHLADPEKIAISTATNPGLGSPVGAVPPVDGGRQPDDPLMFSQIKQACSLRGQAQAASWDEWGKKLKAPWGLYWSAAMHECDNHFRAAIGAWSELLAWLDEKVDSPESSPAHYAALRVEATSRLIKSRRALGERESLGPEYEGLVAAWHARNLTATSMGLHPAAFALRQIDDLLWAARQKTLDGDLSAAETLGRDALERISRGFSDPAFVPSNFRRDLSNFRCEALHFLAFRVAFERRDWNQAVLLTEDALQTLPISREWQRRLQSQAVIYDFAGGQMASARRRLEQILGDSRGDGSNDSLRAFTLFWMARVYEQMGQKTESDFYLRSLIQEQPLSFYSVVAGPLAGLLPADSWQQPFGSLENLKSRLRRVGWGEDGASDQDGLGPDFDRSRRTAELLVKSGLGRWARSAVWDAADLAGKISRPDRNPSVFLYLSRLAYSSGDFAKAIEMTTAIANALPGFWSKYPEQLLIAFPIPRIQTFASASPTGRRLTLMLGIARQESSFRPDALSAARAFGYMQITPATARKILGDQAPASEEAIEAMLMDPATSIRLSARFLDQLSDRFGASETLMAAAYNAGEYAAALWRKQRDVQDDTLFLEGIPYGETKGYAKAVMRNATIYRWLLPLTREPGPGIKKDPS